MEVGEFAGGVFLEEFALLEEVAVEFLPFLFTLAGVMPVAEGGVVVLLAGDDVVDAVVAQCLEIAQVPLWARRLVRL